MPAEYTAFSGDLRFSYPSAMGLRQILPVQMNKMLFIT